jgi:hypothetical protein
MLFNLIFLFVGGGEYIEKRGGVVSAKLPIPAKLFLAF